MRHFLMLKNVLIATHNGLADDSGESPFNFTEYFPPTDVTRGGVAVFRAHNVQRQGISSVAVAEIVALFEKR